MRTICEPQTSNATPDSRFSKKSMVTPRHPTGLRLERRSPPLLQPRRPFDEAPEGGAKSCTFFPVRVTKSSFSRRSERSLFSFSAPDVMRTARHSGLSGSTRHLVGRGGPDKRQATRIVRNPDRFHLRSPLSWMVPGCVPCTTGRAIRKRRPERRSCCTDRRMERDPAHGHSTGVRCCMSFYGFIRGYFWVLAKSILWS